jgi:hypothetical protein
MKIPNMSQEHMMDQETITEREDGLIIESVRGPLFRGN